MEGRYEEKSTLEEKFIMVKGERKRLQEEVEQSLFMQQHLKTENECHRLAVSELEFFREMSKDSPYLNFEEYNEGLKGLYFNGKLIIRPYANLYEATMDGVKGCADVGLLGETISIDDGLLFAVKLPNREDKFFGYVLYDFDGNIVRARHAFNMDIKNEYILKYLKLFAQDILIPAMQREVHTA